MTAKRKKFLTPTKVVLGSSLLAVIVVLGTWLLLRGANIPILNPQGVIAVQQKNLIIFTLLLSVIVVVPVFTMLGLFAWKYRESNTQATYTPDADGNKVLELLWWGIPIAIIGVLGTVTWITTHELDPAKPLASQQAPLKVQVVALQWKWLFLYPDQGIASLNELKIPTGTPVQFDITADGPMSALWIPSLGTQIYAMTGMSSKLNLQADKPGVYRGSNSNINGVGYADMSFNAIALPSRKDFDAWADSIKSDESHHHMDGTEYEELAKPSRGNKVTYYHLHDTALYSKIVQKYMSAGDTMEADGHTHAEGEEH